MFKLPSSKSGFTLIELLIVIVIIALLLGILLPNMLGMRERARDSETKSELRELKLAVELYADEFQGYPEGHANKMYGCGTTPPAICNDGDVFRRNGIDFMQEMPDDYNYEQPDSTSFYIWKLLENESDQDIERSWAKCGITSSPDPQAYFECSF